MPGFAVEGRLEGFLKFIAWFHISICGVAREEQEEVKNTQLN